MNDTMLKLSVCCMMILGTSACSSFPPITRRCEIEGVRLTLINDPDQIDTACQLGMNARSHDSNMPDGQRARFAGCADPKSRHIVADPEDADTLQHEIYHLIEALCPEALKK